MNQFNKQNSSIKRIMAEWTEMKKNPSSDFIAEPDENNLFEWHVVFKGPVDTEFQGGIYHARIALPDTYPKKAPDVYILTPNGRFHTTGEKICLSNTSFHQESWTPLWGIQTIIKALIAFFPVVSEGIGALNYSADVRKQLARESLHWKCTICKNSLSKELLERKISDEDVNEKKVEEIQIVEEKSPILDMSPLGQPQVDLAPQMSPGVNPQVETLRNPIATPNHVPLTRMTPPVVVAPRIVETSILYKMINILTLMVGIMIAWILYRKFNNA